MATFSGNITLKFKGSYADSPDVGSLSHSFSEQFAQAFTNGTGADQANAIYTDSRDISGNDDLDLAGGLSDSYGNALTFTSIKAIIVKAADDNTANITMGAEGTNPFGTMFADDSDSLVLPPGAMFCLTNPAADGFTVTASTGDILRFAPASGTQTYELIIIGEI